QRHILDATGPAVSRIVLLRRLSIANSMPDQAIFAESASFDRARPRSMKSVLAPIGLTTARASGGRSYRARTACVGRLLAERDGAARRAERPRSQPDGQRPGQS